VSVSPPAARVTFLTGPVSLWRSLREHRGLIVQLARREVEARYRGSRLGLLWSVLTPLVMLLIYTFAFGAVFRMRWPRMEDQGLAAFALVLFCSLLPFNLFSECTNRAPSLVLGVPNFVKKVVFPLEILVVSAFGAALFQAVVSLGVLVAADWLVVGHVPWTVVLTPIAAIPLVAMTLGLAWFLASLGVFLRDIGHSVGLAVQVLLFTTPVFFPVEAVPASFQGLIWANPLTWVVEDFRRTVLWGQPPDWTSLLWRVPLSLVVTIAGYVWFMRSKRGFADVM
jgi:lipopolysaccharide transport system permease protein